MILVSGGSWDDRMSASLAAVLTDSISPADLISHSRRSLSVGKWGACTLGRKTMENALATFSLPRLCLEGSYFLSLKGPGSATRPGRFPRLRPLGSPSLA